LFLSCVVTIKAHISGCSNMQEDIS